MIRIRINGVVHSHDGIPGRVRTLCTEHWYRSEGPASLANDDEIDCMTCLVVMARLGLQ